MDKVLTFRLCGGLFGIDITIVKEINRNIEFTPVPGSPSHVVGLFNMRGQVVTLFNLGTLMSYEGVTVGKQGTCIILKASPNDPNQLGFLIDGTGDVIDVEPEQCEPPPSNIGVSDGEFIKNVLKLDDNLLMILNPQKIFTG